MAIDYAALKVEIGLVAYQANFQSGNDIGLCSQLNGINNSINIDRGVINAQEVTAAIVPSEYLALTAPQQSLCNFYSGAGTVDSANANVRQFFSTVFAGTVSLTNLQKLTTRKGSRAEQMFGAGTVLTPADMAIARNS